MSFKSIAWGEDLSVDWISAQTREYSRAEAQEIVRATPVLPHLTHRVYETYGKRVLDCSLILLALPIALPLILGCALLAALGGGTPFYWQERIGRNGKVFFLLKIRTMIPDAEAALEAHLAANPAARKEWDNKQKLINDPRITRIGALLR